MLMDSQPAQGNLHGEVVELVKCLFRIYKQTVKGGTCASGVVLEASRNKQRLVSPINCLKVFLES